MFLERIQKRGQKDDISTYCSMSKQYVKEVKNGKGLT